MKYGIVYVGFISLLAHCAALKFGPFENVTDGIWDDWERENPENVKGGRFGIQYGNDRLWLVSRRQYRTGFKDPWDPASRGGIVSTLPLSNATWSHESYGRLDEDQYGDKLFSLNGRLFMLTYRTNDRKIVYHKLFFWEDKKVRWLEIPFKVDAEAITLANNSVAHLSVSVPRQNGRTAMLVASTHGYANRGSEMVYAMLQVQFRGSVPTEAELKFQARVQDDEPSAVFFTALRNNTLFGFVQNMYSEGYVAATGYAYALDLTTNNVTKVNLAGDAPPMLFDDERMFQTRDDLFIVGGFQVTGLGQLSNVKDIWSLHFDTLQWRGTNGKIPEDSGDVAAYDQRGAMLYLAGLKEGVKVAQVYA